MKIKKIVVATSMLIGYTMSFADTTKNSLVNSNYWLKPFMDTKDSLTNKNNTWGSQDRSGQWYLGVGVSGFASNFNTKGSNSGWSNIIGYNLNKYFAIQYNQFATYNGMFSGLAEGVINLSNSTMYTPYATGGIGWANLSGKGAGAWDVGGGLKFELSKNLQASVDYRYIQTIGACFTCGGLNKNQRGATNQIGAGLTWFFGAENNSVIKASNIEDSTMKVSDVQNTDLPSIDETKYNLPKGIRQCEGNFNLTKDGVACYTVDGSNVTVYLDTKFAYNSDSLNQKGKEAISSFVDFIKSSDIKSVAVKGYASKGKTGPEYERYNQKLSERRANAVASYMKELGLDGNMIITKGFGYNETLSGIDHKNVMNQRVQANVSAPLKTNNN